MESVKNGVMERWSSGVMGEIEGIRFPFFPNTPILQYSNTHRDRNKFQGYPSRMAS